MHIYLIMVTYVLNKNKKVLSIELNIFVFQGQIDKFRRIKNKWHIGIIINIKQLAFPHISVIVFVSQVF